MNRRYLPVGIIVLIIGFGFILLPQKIEMHMAPEMVTVWEDKTTTVDDFTFNTGSQSISGGLSPHIKVWSNDMVTLNTSFGLFTDGESNIIMNMTDNPSEFLLPGEGPYHLLINGFVVEGITTEVNTELYYLRPLEPEYMTFYPYRSFGYGMVVIGILASVIFYMRKAPKLNL